MKIIAGLMVFLSLGMLVGCGGPAKSDDTFTVIFSQCNNAEPYRAAQNAKLKELCDA